MKRISDEDIGDSLDLDIEYTYHCADGSRILTVDIRPSLDRQLQADKEAVKAKREEIANILRNYRSDIINNHAYLAEVVADQIIKLIKGEE